MSRILSVSYDETLLLTRELMLKGAGHNVHSCLGYHDSITDCAAGPFDFAIIGHSIPKQDKLDIIVAFRRDNPAALVVALTRAGESRLNEVDFYVTPGDPEELIRALDRIVSPGTDRDDTLRRIK